MRQSDDESMTLVYDKLSQESWDTAYRAANVNVSYDNFIKIIAKF